MWKRLPTWAKWTIGVLGVAILIGLANNLTGNTSVGTESNEPVPPQRFESVRKISSSEAVGETYAAHVPIGASPELMTAWSRDLCEGESFCQVLGWKDASLMASAMPMTDREVNGLSFSYSLNRTTGNDKAVWDCTAWPGTADVCIAQE
jgi:hypothetical protein